MRYTNKIHSGSPQLPLMQYAYNNVCTDKSSFQFCAILRCYGYIGSIKGSSKRYTCQVREWVLCVCVVCYICVLCVHVLCVHFLWVLAFHDIPAHVLPVHPIAALLLGGGVLHMQEQTVVQSSTFCLPCIRAYHVVILYVSVLLPPTCL